MDRPDITMSQLSLNPNAARRLSHTTKSVPMMDSITPRWLLRFLPWVPVEAGIYRVNRIKKTPCMEEMNEYGEKLIAANYMHINEDMITQTFPEYEEEPREYMLSLVQTILRLNINVTDIFNKPIDQKNEQMRLTIEAMKERQECEIINDSEFGLVNNVSPDMIVRSRHGSPTPDDMDELLAKVWKKPAFFLAHPKAIAAFGRECTCRGVPPVVINMFGSPFITWRGVPIVPCDKLFVGGKSFAKAAGGRTNILLMRVGEKEQGVIGLHQPGIPDETDIPSLSIKFAGIDNRGIASYILSLYFSVAVLADDALAMLEDVEVGNYYDYR
ncbi:MAG: family 2A encapsulin nanocompartment shell protein [Burkholderiales bacterium]